MRRILRDYASILRRREVKKITDSNYYKSISFALIKDMLRKNSFDGYVGFNNSGFYSVLPINRRTEHVDALSSLNKNISLKLKNLYEDNNKVKRSLKFK